MGTVWLLASETICEPGSKLEHAETVSVVASSMTLVTLATVKLRRNIVMLLR